MVQCFIITFIKTIKKNYYENREIVRWGNEKASPTLRKENFLMA